MTDTTTGEARFIEGYELKACKRCRSFAHLVFDCPDGEAGTRVICTACDKTTWYPSCADAAEAWNDGRHPNQQPVPKCPPVEQAYKALGSFSYMSKEGNIRMLTDIVPAIIAGYEIGLREGKRPYEAMDDILTAQLINRTVTDIETIREYQAMGVLPQDEI